jgi:hypothetical protein
MAFLTPTGTLVPVRCGSPNLCSYCAFMSAAIDGMMVLLDALDNSAPTISLTVTTQKAHTEPQDFRRDVEQLFKAIRRRAPEVEYLGRIEFTTGEGKRSGGHRRINQHTLVKGLDPHTAAVIQDDVVGLWKRRTGAYRVELAQLRSAAGAAHYLTTHHSKATQAPSKGWTGRRLRASRGYFAKPGAERRAEAAAVLRDRRAERRLLDLLEEQGLTPSGVRARLGRHPARRHRAGRPRRRVHPTCADTTCPSELRTGRTARPLEGRGLRSSPRAVTATLAVLRCRYGG